MAVRRFPRRRPDYVLDVDPFMRLELWELDADPDGRVHYAYRFWDRRFNEERPIFEGTDASATVPIDRAAVEFLGFMSLTEGQVENDYFESYDGVQLAWRDERAQDLANHLAFLEEREEERTSPERRTSRKQDWNPRRRT